MEIKQLKKYLNTCGCWVMLVFGSIFCILPLVGIINLLRGKVGTDTLFSILLFLVSGGIMVFVGLRTILEVKEMYRTLEETGEIRRVLADFASAQPMVKDQLRMGQYYIFGKGKNRIVRYEEIRQVYQHITRQYLIETDRYLKYVDSKGKTRNLCSLQLRGKSDEEVLRIMMIIRTKNPNVKLGYK